ncbi:MAG: LLM class F420-dependent oxidoreductase [Dehalococcoidia bacterium]
MRFGLALPNYARWFDADGAREIAVAAEQLGYHSIYVNDHVVIPGHEVSMFGNAYFDAFTTLGFLAAVTERVRLGTTVVVVPYRNPVVQAKMIASLDVYSKGRITFAVGVGHVPEESAALGVPYDVRGPMTDEYLKVMRTIWTDDEAGFHGRWVNFDHMHPLTRPVQQPLPVHYGGRGPRALRRVVELCQGWQPMSLTPEQATEQIATLRGMATAAGRTDHIEVALRWPLHLVERSEDAPPIQHQGEIRRARRAPAESAELVARYAEAGVDELIVDLPANRAVMSQQMEWISPARLRRPAPRPVAEPGWSCPQTCGSRP